MAARVACAGTPSVARAQYERRRQAKGIRLRDIKPRDIMAAGLALHDDVAFTLFTPYVYTY